MQYFKESKINTRIEWYFGNNRSKNLRLSKPQWYAPFFLTTDYLYASNYADYGVYKIDLQNETNLNILDFKKIHEISKLHWPQILINQILTGKSDLNSIAYDLYLLAHNAKISNEQLQQISNTQTWRTTANYFKEKSIGILNNITPSQSIWGKEKDHQFLLQMWKDIFDAKFNGFIQYEFGKEIMAIFTFKCIDKISINPINPLAFESCN